MNAPEPEVVAAYDPEELHPELKAAPAEPVVLRLRGGEPFLASEIGTLMFEQMHRVLDVIQAENDACEAGVWLEGVS